LVTQFGDDRAFLGIVLPLAGLERRHRTASRYLGDVAAASSRSMAAMTARDERRVLQLDELDQPGAALWRVAPREVVKRH
jgi:hypothetical protein